MSGFSVLDRKIRAIVIGASAGGFNALKVIFSRLGTTCDVPILVVLHVRKGSVFLPNIFQLKYGSKRIIKEAEDKEVLQAGFVYFAPADYHLLIERQESLSLSTEELIHFSRPSIDPLFESAADCFGSRLLGILLSGANDDGACGLQRIHEAGGLTVVQDPSTSTYSTMPASALKLFQPTRVLSPPEIGDLLSGPAAQPCAREATL
jgi:two-component system, chemotaxis family, protein-glutamate methylesterase/glutaminase